jgi:Zn finger protein HypA/HybF involved in hydrogenase expression
MHELSLAMSLVDIVQEEGEIANGATKRTELARDPIK